MNEWSPKTFGQILDRIFQVVKENFWCLFVLTVFFMGPSLVLGIFLRPSYPAVDWSSVGSMDYWVQWYDDYTVLAVSDSMAVMLIKQFLGLIQYVVSGLGGVLSAAVAVFLVDEVRRRRTPDMKVLIKRALGRLWPLLGSTLLYWLIVFGLIIGFYIGCILVVAVLAFAISPLVADVGLVAVFLLVIPVVLGAVGFLLYFAVRWALAPAATAMAPVAPGISQSWRLTRENGWRAVGVVVVSAVIVFAVTSIFEAAFLFLGSLGAVLSIPLQLVATVVSSTTVAVLFFDMEARNHAGDMKAMVDHLDAVERQAIEQQGYGYLACEQKARGQQAVGLQRF